MSRSSLGTNRLFHVSDLPNSKKYSTYDINKLLPIHFSTLRENILTMIYYEAKNFNDRILLHDANLNLNSTNYTQIKGGWCEDFDNSQQNSGTNHIKKCIEIGSHILNYMQAVSSATMINKNQQNNQQNQSKQYQTQTKMIVKSQHVRNIQGLTSQKVLKKSNSKKYIHEFLTLDLQKQLDQFSSINNIVISYNIYKKNKKCIFLIGTNPIGSRNFYNTIKQFRNWNGLRLKANKNIAFNFQKLYRASVYLQHLFSISRGFIFTYLNLHKYHDSIFPSVDLNDNKKHLKKLLQYLDIEKDLQYSSELIFQKIKHQQKQLYWLLEDTIKIYRFCLTYKLQNSSNQQQKLALTNDIEIKFANFLTKALSQIPINLSISFHCQCKHNQNTNQFYFIFIVNYKSHLTRHIFLDQHMINICLKNVTEFLNKKSYQQVRKAENSIADEVFKSSYRIFNKYNELVEKLDNQIHPNSRVENQYSQKFNQIKLSTNKKSQKPLQSQFKDLQYSQSNRKYQKSKLFSLTNQKYQSPKMQQYEKSSVGSTIFSKQKGASQIQTQYKKLIRSIQQRRTNKTILNPVQLKHSLKNYLDIYDQINRSNALQKHQKISLQFVGICNEYLTEDDIFSLYEKYEDNADAISDFFMQEHSYSKMINVGMLFTKRIQNLFKSYINEGTNFSNFRFNIIVNYLKKILQKYHLKVKKNNQTDQLNSVSKQQLKSSPSKSKTFLQRTQTRNSPQKIQNTENSSFLSSNFDIQGLIYLLQKRNYNGQEYKRLVNAHIKQILENKPEIKFISAVLHNYYVYLVNNDHHQDLVSSFIGQIFYQVLYFTNELTTITLNNSRYRKNTADIKTRKIYQVIRQGGLLSFGYQIRNVLLPILMNTEPYLPYQTFIVTTIRIQKLAYFKTTLKMIQNSYFTQNFHVLNKYIKRIKIYLTSLSRQICMPFYKLQLSNELQKKLYENVASYQKEAIQDPLLNIELSQSGIFKELVEMNSGIKIAGRNLKQQYARKMQQVQQQRRKYSVDSFLHKIADINLQQCWQYIQLALNVQQKYLQTQIKNKYEPISIHSNNISEDILYLRQTLQHIYTKLSKIYQYIALSDVIYRVQSGKNNSIINSIANNS